MVVCMVMNNSCHFQIENCHAHDRTILYWAHISIATPHQNHVVGPKSFKCIICLRVSFTKHKYVLLFRTLVLHEVGVSSLFVGGGWWVGGSLVVIGGHRIIMVILGGSLAVLGGPL